MFFFSLGLCERGRVLFVFGFRLGWGSFVIFKLGWFREEFLNFRVWGYDYFVRFIC